MEGKEVRFGIANSALWASATTAASNGSVNSMHDSYTPLGGLVPLFLMQFSEVIFGGVGSGLYGMLVFVFVAVFIAGLMVGRTPEYLGKKIEAYEMKMASLVVLIPSVRRAGVDCPGGGRGTGPQDDLQPGRPRFLRGALRLHVAGQQQRQRLRRPGRQQPVLQHHRRHRHALRPLLAGHSDAGDRRVAGEEEAGAGRAGDAAHAHASLRRVPDRRGRAGGSA